MHPSPVLRGALLAALVSLGAACEGAGPFTAESASNEPPGAAEGMVVGRVQSVEPSERMLTLSGDVRIQMTASTSIDEGGDFSTLVEVLAAIQVGTTVLSEAEGFLEAGVLIAQRIRFVEEDSADSEEDESADGNGEEEDGEEENNGAVTGIVASLDLLARTCSTTDGMVIRIASDSVIDLAGDLHTLADVALRLTLGTRVRVEAEGVETASGLVASNVKFEVDP